MHTYLLITLCFLLLLLLLLDPDDRGCHEHTHTSVLVSLSCKPGPDRVCHEHSQPEGFRLSFSKSIPAHASSLLAVVCFPFLFQWELFVGRFYFFTRSISVYLQFHQLSGFQNVHTGTMTFISAVVQFALYQRLYMRRTVGKILLMLIHL